MGSSLSLGKIFGIPIRLHFTWFFVFILITAFLIALPIPGAYILWFRIVIAIIGSLLLFISILVHELAHSLIAIKNNIPVNSITLFVFGGVSHITKEASNPKIEMLIAAVGPLASIIIASIFYAIHLLLIQFVADPLLITIAQWLAFINALMAMFNLIPGFPLDGGRIFRSIIWARTNNYVKSTRIATTSGRIVGYIFIVGGIIFMFVTGEWMNGLWLAFIGWFLETSATISYRETLLRDTLNKVTAREVMNTDCPIILRELNLKELIHSFMTPTGHRCFIVATIDGKFEGFIILKKVKSIPQNNWESTSVGEIMIQDDSLSIAHPDQNALSLLEKMDAQNIDYVPVVEEEKIIGLIARDNLMQLPQIRAALKI